MKYSFLYTLLLTSSLVFAQEKESYPDHPDSILKQGVPTGEVKGPFSFKSDIFPGTVRNYWVYVPSQYSASKPACLMVIQDGLSLAKRWKLPTTFDNLIHEKAMPVTLGLFVTPGSVPATSASTMERRNRSFEYDSLGDRYARFLIEELIPELKQTYNISDDPNDRAIGGSSSGAICAFTAAWERPDAFRRVYSGVGTFTGLRGGDAYAVLIRKMEPKPIRIFLQDGRNDLDIYAGRWWDANQEMLHSLQFAGYDVNHAWGNGGHNSLHSASITPDALRWLWRDYPKPIESGQAPTRRLELLLPGEDWELVSDGHRYTEGPAITPQGEVVFTEGAANSIFKIDSSEKPSLHIKSDFKVGGLMYGPDGYLYSTQGGSNQLVRYDTHGKEEVLFDNAPCNDLVILANGHKYYTDPKNHRIWHISPSGKRSIAHEGIENPNGIIASSDQSLIYAADTKSNFVYSFQVQPDGSLAHGQPYFHMHTPPDTNVSGADGMTVDNEGNLYVATTLGLQVFDPDGRCHFILSKPQNKKLSNVVFGGPNRDTLYVTCTDKVYKRKIDAIGAVPWELPLEPFRGKL
ncbi:SMP-30/gluconolactonase/LRE family protein [Opitutaceae bacterium]|nr:SMP-30/gluconolactonase/LRE family protein [Opitutaceae bacterium]